MKRTKEIFIVFTCLLMWAVLLGGWTTYDTATPLGSDAPSVIDDRIREVKAAVQERMDVCGYWPLTGTEVSNADAGKFRYLIFREPNDLTTMSADESSLFSKNVSSVTELHWIDESDNVVQLTSGGYIYGNNLKADSVLTAAIADANITNALMADDSIDSDQYVDGSIDTVHIADANITAAKIADIFGTQTSKDSGGSNNIVAGSTYQVSGDGFISVTGTHSSGVGHTLTLKVDDTDGTTAVMAETTQNESGKKCAFSYPIPKDYYFTIATTNVTLTYVKWTPIGSGECVKQ